MNLKTIDNLSIAIFVYSVCCLFTRGYRNGINSVFRFMRVGESLWCYREFFGTFFILSLGCAFPCEIWWKYGEIWWNVIFTRMYFSSNLWNIAKYHLKIWCIHIWWFFFPVLICEIWWNMVKLPARKIHSHHEIPWWKYPTKYLISPKNLEGFHNGDTQNGWFTMEHPIKMDKNWGTPHFRAASL